MDKAPEGKELENIIRHGAKQIFEDQDDSAVVTQAMVDELMDRERYIRLRNEERSRVRGDGADDSAAAGTSWLDAFNVSRSCMHVIWTGALSQKRLDGEGWNLGPQREVNCLIRGR